MQGAFADLLLGKVDLPNLRPSTSGKVIYSIKHNRYIIINKSLATCFGSSEPSSGQFLEYGHGAVSECARYGIQYCLKTIFVLKYKLKIYWLVYL
jgi:hypothetical protein